MYMIDLVVTRHPALIEYLKEQGIATDATEVITHVSDLEVLKGKNVAGVLPVSLASFTETFTEVKMDLPANKRGQELSLEEVKMYADGIRTYKVIEHVAKTVTFTAEDIAYEIMSCTDKHDEDSIVIAGYPNGSIVTHRVGSTFDSPDHPVGDFVVLAETTDREDEWRFPYEDATIAQIIEKERLKDVIHTFNS